MDEPASPHDLLDPPLLEHLLFEYPYGVVAILGVVCVGLMIAARVRDSKPCLKGAGGCVLIIVILVALGYFVETDREVLTRLTRQMVLHSAPLDIPRLRKMFDPNATLAGPDGSDWMTLNETLDRVDRLDRKTPIRSQLMLRIESETTPGPITPGQTTPDEATSDRLRGRTKLNLMTTVETGIGDRPYLTMWIIHWAQPEDRDLKDNNDGWWITKVQWIEHPHPGGIQPRSQLR